MFTPPAVTSKPSCSVKATPEIPKVATVGVRLRIVAAELKTRDRAFINGGGQREVAELLAGLQGRRAERGGNRLLRLRGLPRERRQNVGAFSRRTAGDGGNCWGQRLERLLEGAVDVEQG